jgi:hypothetical protein
MKNSLVTYLLGFFFLITCCKALGRSLPSVDTSNCLEIVGTILNTADGTDGMCVVELVHANNVLESVLLKKGKKKFSFILKKNTTYTIRVSKVGFITRLVCVDTKMLKSNYELYNFSFETKLVEQANSEKLNKDFLDFPIALIYFDNRKDDFVYDKEYTTKIKKEIALK